MAGKRGRPRKTPEPNPYSPDEDPLDFLRQVWNNPNEKRELRVRAAITAAQYKHVKGRDGGKKDGRQAAAEELVAKNTNLAPRDPPKVVAPKLSVVK